MPTDQILYSDKYNDDLFEYRYSYDERCVVIRNEIKQITNRLI